MNEINPVNIFNIRKKYASLLYDTEESKLTVGQVKRAVEILHGYQNVDSALTKQHIDEMSHVFFEPIVDEYISLIQDIYYLKQTLGYGKDWEYPRHNKEDEEKYRFKLIVTEHRLLYVRQIIYTYKHRFEDCLSRSLDRLQYYTTSL